MGASLITHGEKEMATLKRDFSAKITDLKGKPLKLGATPQAFEQAINAIWPKLSPELQAEFTTAMDAAAGTEATLADVACTALLPNGFTEQDKSITPEAGMKRFKLALRLSDGGVQEIDTAERDLIKDLVNKHHSLLVRGRVDELLETDAE